MDIRYEKPLSGKVLQAYRFTAHEALEVGKLVDFNAGRVANSADATVAAVGFTVQAASAQDDPVQIMPFVPGHIYSCPAVAGVVPGDNLEFDQATDDFVESAVAPMAIALPSGQLAGLPDARTFFTVTAGALMG